MRALARGTVVLGLVAASLAVATPAHADPVRDLEYWLDDYGIREAWNTTRGAGVTIAVIDTGIDGTHPDLAGAVVGGSDFSGLGARNGQQPVGSTGSEHGTLVGSLAAGRGSAPDTGVIGAAPEADLLSLSIGFGEGEIGSDDQIASAVRWAVDNGADVINMSLTRNTRDWPESWDDAFLYAMDNDVVVVAAAGNRGTGTYVVGAPATMPGVLTVGGVTRDEQVSAEASSQGITIGVSAPSEELVGALPGGGHAQWGGTSGASPIVAGIVALVRAAHPELDAANVINRITETARDRGPSGQDYSYGFGLVDAAAAVNDRVPEVDENPMGDLREWIRVNRRAPADDPTAAPTPLEPSAPPLTEARGPSGTLYPTPGQLRDVGIPLLVFAVFGGAFVVATARAVRAYGAARRRG